MRQVHFHAFDQFIEMFDWNIETVNNGNKLVEQGITGNAVQGALQFICPLQQFCMLFFLIAAFIHNIVREAAKSVYRFDCIPL